MMAFSPELEISRGQEYVARSSSAGPSISISLGVGMRFHLSRSLSLTAAGEYLRARPTFDVEYTSNNTIETQRVYQDISTFSVLFGFAFRLF
jgi:hypothetical protein